MFYLDGGCLPLHLCLFTVDFYVPGLKGPPGASSNRIVCPSVRLSARPSVRPSIRLSVCLSVCPYFRPAYKQSAIFKVWVVIQ